MPADTLSSAVEEAKEAKKSANNAAAHSERSFNEAVTAAERTLSEAAKTAERVLKEGVDTLKAQTRAYGDNAGQHFDEAQRYVVERVKERPVTATLAGLGVGLLLGLLLANRNSKLDPKAILRGVVGITMLATAGGVFVVAVAYGLFALAETWLPPAGAAAVVAGLAALGLMIGGLAMSARPRRPNPPPPEGFAEKALNLLKDKPIVAVVAAVGLGILAVRNPQYFGAAVRAFMEPRNPPK